MSDLVSATAELAQCEETIEQGIQTFVEVGRALMRIRNGKLYREAGFKTFEAYCKRRWSFTDNYARRIIDAAEAARNLKSVPIGTVLPIRETQVRPLTRLPAPPQQQQAWGRAVERAGGKQPTAKQVADVVVEMMRPNTRNEGDSDEVIWARGLMNRAEIALGSAAFEDWSHFTVRQAHVTAAKRAARAWGKLADYLNQLYENKNSETRAA